MELCEYYGIYPVCTVEELKVEEENLRFSNKRFCWDILLRIYYQWCHELMKLHFPTERPRVIPLLLSII